MIVDAAEAECSLTHTYIKPHLQQQNKNLTVYRGNLFLDLDLTKEAFYLILP